MMIASQRRRCQRSTHKIWCPQFIHNTIGCVLFFGALGYDGEKIDGSENFLERAMGFSNRLSTGAVLGVKKGCLKGDHARDASSFFLTFRVGAAAFQRIMGVDGG